MSLRANGWRGIFWGTSIKANREDWQGSMRCSRHHRRLLFAVSGRRRDVGCRRLLTNYRKVPFERCTRVHSCSLSLLLFPFIHFSPTQLRERLLTVSNSLFFPPLTFFSWSKNRE